MKFVKVCSLYEPFLDQFYSNYDCSELSYVVHRDKIFEQQFAWCNYWPRYLNDIYKIEGEEIIHNALDLQIQWCREHGKAGALSEEEIVLEQLKQIQPEIVFFETLSLARGFFRRVKEEVASVRFIIAIDGVHRCDVARVSGADLMFGVLPETTDFYQSYGMQAANFRLGIAYPYVDPASFQTNKQGISFAGSFFPGKGGHEGRRQLLTELVKKVDLELYLSGVPCLSRFDLKYILGGLYRGNFKQRMQVYPLARRNRGAVFGRDMYRTLAESLITLNSHIDVAGDRAVNMRLYEATGMGTCLLTDYKSNIGEVFEIDTEIVTYKSIPEAIEKCQFLLENPDRALEIAKRGQERTLREYTLRNSVESSMTRVFEIMGVAA